MKPVKHLHFMKRILISTIAACCSVAAIAQDFKDPQNDPLNAVVRIEVTQNVPNFALPWQNLMPQSGSGSGVVVEGKQILTNAHNVADSSMIKIRKQNEDTLFTAKVKFVDHECDLALLTVDDPNFFKDITPCYEKVKWMSRLFRGFLCFFLVLNELIAV